MTIESTCLPVPQLNLYNSNTQEKQKFARVMQGFESPGFNQYLKLLGMKEIFR